MNLSPQKSLVKLQAKKRFHSGMSDAQNAVESGVSRQTIISWKKKYAWEQDKIEIEERAREKYVEVESDRLVSQTDEIDKDHKDILSAIRGELKKMVDPDVKTSAQDIMNLNAKLLIAEKFIKLDREVFGLTNRANVPKMTFPTGFKIGLKTAQDDVNLSQGLSEDELFSALPNQNEEFFGTEEEMLQHLEQPEDDGDYDYDMQDDIVSLSI